MIPLYLIIHTSASPYGDVDLIDEWHKARGWREIGYHYLVENGYRTSSHEPRQIDTNGLIQQGRAENEIGAHARGYNSKSLGICLIGKNGEYTPEQIASLIGLTVSLLFKYNIPVENVLGHYEADPDSGKTCPDLHMPTLRKKLSRVYGTFLEEMSCTVPEEVY